MMRSILADYKFGFLGEAYIESEEIELFSKEKSEILYKYFSLKKPYYCNRNLDYYSTELDVVFSYIETCYKDINGILTSELNYKLKQYVLFSIMNHLINCVSKLVGIIFSYEKLRSNYMQYVTHYLQLCTDYFVKIIFEQNLTEFVSFDEKTLSEIKEISNSFGNIEVREYSEMDHPLILLNSFFAYEQFLSEKTLILAPLQGACIIPPMYISLLNFIKKESGLSHNVRFEYLRFSTYDSEYYFDIPLNEQVRLLGEKYHSDENILLIDDNTGTATTIKKLESEIGNVFTNITTCVIECRWDTKIKPTDYPNYPAFNLNDIDIITPLCYRHYRRFFNEIEHMRKADYLLSEYENCEFYSLEFIFDDFEFEKYLDTSEILESNKSRLMIIIDNYKSQVRTI